MTVYLVISLPKIPRVGQNRIYSPYVTVYLVISLPNIPYMHCVCMVLANPMHVCVTRCAWWSTCKRLDTFEAWHCADLVPSGFCCSMRLVWNLWPWQATPLYPPSSQIFSRNFFLEYTSLYVDPNQLPEVFQISMEVRAGFHCLNVSLTFVILYN